MVVFPAPLRPISAIFSPRETLAVKFSITCRSPYDFESPFTSSGCLPDGRFIVNRMYGRWILDFARSEVCSRSTSFLRDVTWLERVPAEKRAMNSLSCAIFFSRCKLSASMRERICVFASTMSS